MELYKPSHNNNGFCLPFKMYKPLLFINLGFIGKYSCANEAAVLLWNNEGYV